MSGTSTAVKKDDVKPRQRLNKVAPAEQNKIMEDIIKRAAQKKKAERGTNGYRSIVRTAIAALGAASLSFALVTYWSSPSVRIPGADPNAATASESASSVRSTQAHPSKLPSTEIPFRWPSWAPPREGVKDTLPQNDDTKELDIRLDVTKRNAIKEAFSHSWKAYEQNAWGADEYHPLSKSGSYLADSEQGMGYMIVDSLDSLLVMGFEEEYARAREWVRNELSFDIEGKVNGFEVIIRILGGLLSAYHLTSTHTNPTYHPDAQIFLDKALDLSERLLPLFDTPSGIPLSFIDLAERKAYPDVDNGGMSSLAEAGTMQLEFKYLSEISGKPIYGQIAEKVMKLLKEEMSAEGVAPILINPQTGKFAIFDIRLGSRGDSYYEYLLKQWLQTNRTETVYRQMYETSMKGIEQLLISKSEKQGLVYTHELGPQRGRDGTSSWMIRPKQDHLVCFLGGSLMLGVASAYPNHQPVWSRMSPSQQLDYVAGKSLIDTCVETYEGTETGLGAEIVMFNSPEQSKNSYDPVDWYIKRGLEGEAILDGRNILRPETVESLFLAYRITGEQRYRDQGWRIFQAFQKHCRVRGGGYAGIADVEDGTNVEQLDKMETFWLSETLKYLYLLFSDDKTVPLEQNVFNTEAHIFPVFTPARISKFARGKPVPSAGSRDRNKN